MVIYNKKGEMPVYYMEFPSPVGRLLLLSDGQFLTHLLIDVPVPEGAVPGEGVEALEQTARWLRDYFRGQPRPVDIPLKAAGTEFQKRVWALLADIAWGRTLSYGDIARQLSRQNGGRMSAQAVGQAVGKNPISILIPCHRCVGSQGQMTGYAWGVEKKVWLLRHEGIAVTKGKLDRPTGAGCGAR